MIFNMQQTYKIGQVFLKSSRLGSNADQSNSMVTPSQASQAVNIKQVRFKEFVQPDSFRGI